MYANCLTLSALTAFSLLLSSAITPLMAQEQEESEQSPVIILLPEPVVAEEPEPGVQAQAEEEEPAAAGDVVEVPLTAPFTVYLMRHADTQDSALDPGLTAGGIQRAQGLAQLLRFTDIEVIYSTNYRRSAATALPLARELGLPVQFYPALDTAELVADIRQQGRNTLIIGHSNTLEELVNGFGGELPPLSESGYGDLIQLTLSPADDEQLSVHQIHLVAPLLVSRNGS